MDRLVVFEGVYAPAEDTLLMSKSLENERGSFLEVGCGSGYISIEYAFRNGVADCCDKNLLALKNAAWNSLVNNVEVRVFYSDVFSEVRNRYEVIAFNPPYLDNISGDDATEDNGAMWRYVEEVPNYLLKNGRAYILISTENIRYEDMRDILTKNRWKKVDEERLPMERLEVWRFDNI